MDFAELKKRGLEIRNAYDNLNTQKGQKVWDLEQRVSGFVGDVGDLVKLVMAKNGFRDGEDIDKKLAHELSDCLWSIITIADKLDIDLEKEYMKTMNELEKRIDNSKE